MVEVWVGRSDHYTCPQLDKKMPADEGVGSAGLPSLSERKWETGCFSDKMMNLARGIIST